MNRGILALGAGVVLAALLGLYIVLQADGEPGRTSQAGKPAAPASPAAQNIAEAGSGKPRIISPDPGSSSNEYISAGMRVHDDRAGEHTQVKVSPPAHRRDRREIASPITSDLAQRIRPLLRPCVAGVSPEVLGARPRVEGEVIIAIKDHQATVTSAALQLRDVADEAQGEVKQCLARSVVGLVAPAGDESDLDGYPITLSLSMP